MKGMTTPLFRPKLQIQVRIGMQFRAWLFRKLFSWVVNTELDELPSDMVAFIDMVLGSADWEDWYRWGKDA